MIGGIEQNPDSSPWQSRGNDQVAHAPIIHVAVAVAHTDETYGA